MNTQKEFNKIMDRITEFENIATKTEKKKVFRALKDYLRSKK